MLRQVYVQKVDNKLVKQAIGVQLGTDGWKRKNVNEAQKIQNFIAYKDKSVARRRRWSCCVQLLMSLNLAMLLQTAFCWMSRNSVHQYAWRCALILYIFAMQWVSRTLLCM